MLSVSLVSMTLPSRYSVVFLGKTLVVVFLGNYNITAEASLGTLRTKVMLKK